MPINLQHLREMLTVTLANGDRYRFSWLNPEEAFHLTSKDVVELDDREYVVEALVTLSEEPLLEAEELKQWTDVALLELATRYLSIDAGVEEAGKAVARPSPKDLAACRQALQKQIVRDRDRLIERSRHAMEALSRNLSGLFLTDSLRVAQSLTKSLDRFYQEQQAIREGFLDRLTAMGQLGGITQSTLNDFAIKQSDFVSSLQNAVIGPASIQARMTQFMQSLTNYDFSRSLSNLNLIVQSGFSEQWEQFHRDRRAELLIGAHLGFLNDFTEDLIADLVDGAPFRVRKQQRAFITRQLYRLTASSEFWSALENELQMSPTLQRRLPILRSAHKAHQRREFVLSVPALLAQMEGILADVACELGLIRWNHLSQKWYQTDPQSGSYRLSRTKGKRIEVSGLNALTDRGLSSTLPSLGNTVPHIREDEANMRNRILHGTHTTYGRTSRHSSKLFLIILKLATELRLRQQEAGKV